jgi:hypothetical protein
MKVLNQTLIAALVLGSGFGLTACGKGFQNYTAANSTSENGKTNVPSDGDPGGGGDGGATPNPINDSLPVYKGRPTSGGAVAGQGQLLLEIDRVNEALILVIPIPTEILPYLGVIVEKNIPELPGAKIIPRGQQLAVSIPLKYIVRNGQYRDPQFNNLLPNGDRLPNFPAGEGANFSLSITGKYVANIYLGAGAAAVFVETPGWDSFMKCTGLSCLLFQPFPIQNEAKTKILGYVSIVPAKSVFHSGVYVSSVLDDQLARFIDDHLKY